MALADKVQMIQERIRRENAAGPAIISTHRAVRYPLTGALLIWRIKATTSNYAYYTCQAVTIDATDFNTGNTSPIEYAGPDVTVFNIAEAGETNAAALSVGDILIGFATTDDEGHAIKVGWSPKFAWIP